MRLSDIEQSAQALIGLPLRIIYADRESELDDLSAGEREEFSALENPARRRDWLIGRKALKTALRAQSRSPDTASLRLPDPRVSLTHGGGSAFAGAVLGSSPGIGIDFERVRDVDPRVAEWFLDPAERLLLPPGEGAGYSRQLVRLWTIKEAAFKSHPDNHGMTLGNFRIHEAVDEQRTIMETNSGERLRVFSALHRDGYLSIAGVMQ